MKLNLQHLDRQMTNSDTDPEKLKSRVSKITSSMIEQIEALSKIASDFSKFAKPIEQDFYPIEINELVESVSEFYLQDDSISLNVDLHKEPLHVADVTGGPGPGCGSDLLVAVESDRYGRQKKETPL